MLGVFLHRNAAACRRAANPGLHPDFRQDAYLGRSDGGNFPHCAKKHENRPKRPQVVPASGLLRTFPLFYRRDFRHKGHQLSQPQRPDNRNHPDCHDVRRHAFLQDPHRCHREGRSSDYAARHAADGSEERPFDLSLLVGHRTAYAGRILFLRLFHHRAQTGRQVLGNYNKHLAVLPRCHILPAVLFAYEG